MLRSVSKWCGVVWSGAEPEDHEGKSSRGAKTRGMNLSEFAEAFTILAKYDPKAEVCLERDQVWTGGALPEEMSPEDRDRLYVLGLWWDKETDSWSTYT